MKKETARIKLALPKKKKNSRDQKYADFLYKAYELHPSLASNSITRTMGAQVFRDKKNDARRIVTSAKRYMGLILLYYKTKGIEEDKE